MATTLTSLLDSLHSHLQAQTELLPTLHHQLGLPPSALADDLAALQTELAACVERQIDARRREVDAWMGRCDEAEARCVRYAGALGGHGRASGSSVGEVRKEQVLPRRFERATEHQEKLRQLYHTKLEQLTTLSARLAALARTLGPDFYPPDVLEPHSPAADDEGECRDVTPERFARLEKELVRGKGEVAKRLVQLAATLLTIDWLYTELGVAPPDADDAAENTASLSTRPASACSMRTASSGSSDPFLAASTALATPSPSMRGSKPPSTTPLFLSAAGAPPTPPHDTEREHQRVFLRFVARLEELPEDAASAAPNRPHAGLEGVEPTPGLVAWAEGTRVELEELKRRREAHIQSLYDQLEVLWRRLGVPEREMDAFVEAQRGSTEGTVRAYEEELDRMLELKREKMGTFVENARAEIVKLWDDLMVGEEERAEFAPFADDEFTEDLLTLHEDEIKSLKLERQVKGPLLANIKKYFDILEDQKELAAAAADQTRLLTRGPRDPGRLLREEKMRKRVTKEKPRLEQDLLNTIPQWEAENGRVFLVHGRSILQILLEATATAHEKENGKKTRSGSQSSQAKPAPPPRARTPSNPVHQYVPVPGSSHGTRSTTRASTSTSNSNSTSSRSTSATRRPKLGDSASSRDAPALPSLHRSNSKRAPSPMAAAGKMSLPGHARAAVPVQRSVSYQHPPQHHSQQQQHIQQPQLGPARGPGANARKHAYHPYPQARRTSPAKAAAVRVYGAVALAAQLEKKAARVRRESFRPRPSVDPGEVWAGTSSGGAGADRRFAGMAGGAVVEEEEGA